ncbi:alpha/beta hydrolase [Pararobbsia alpina]|uniref:Monoacylglycerol lipase n=1 Tax=Pararobbsia alpina TaxID=621374 RepID=A0A6S7C447_9BURK|nr:2-succinyl-6-hydroxy-2, 4-cyclohexadiene-1-carboxylate synthase [Pararobbsia alpina]
MQTTQGVQGTDATAATGTTEASEPTSMHDAPDAASPPSHSSTIRTRDGVELALHHWPVEGEGRPRATIALVHGLAEHAGRYAALAQRLNAAGIELFAIDLRGHGQSPGARAWVDRFDQYLLDAEALLGVAARGKSPLFLMGHSMGGTISALYAAERLADDGPSMAGLILSSAALVPGRDVPSWLIALSRIISRVLPRLPTMEVDATWLSRDPGAVEANRADPLVYHGGIPARTGAGLLDAMTRIERGRANLRMPVLVYHGTADKLTEPDGSREFSKHVGSTDRTLVLYEGSYHETMNDLDQERVIDTLIDWILARSLRPTERASP